jgi:hypothetical protein
MILSRQRQHKAHQVYLAMSSCLGEDSFEVEPGRFQSDTHTYRCLLYLLTRCQMVRDLTLRRCQTIECPHLGRSRHSPGGHGRLMESSYWTRNGPYEISGEAGVSAMSKPHWTSRQIFQPLRARLCSEKSLHSAIASLQPTLRPDHHANRS